MSIDAPARQESSDATSGTKWWTLDPDAAVAQARGDASTGLGDDEASRRLAEAGPNEIASAPPPSWLALAARQVVEPMNLMLIAVAVISLFIGQVSTAIIVGLLVVLNVVMGTSQELKARRSVDALSSMQTPHARVTRGGTLRQLPASQLVPGDLVDLEAGDLVPADGRILRAANLETQEAALTGESAPIAKGPTANPAPDTALADRTSMLFQNTSVTRGTATMVVVETGMRTEVGRIATMLTSVENKRSPLQRELDGLTKVLGFIAWGAVALIVVIGALRGEDIGELLFLATAVAISAIPTGLPVFVQALLSWGASKLAAEKAVVASLNDVETLGATSAICSDKTGTLTLNQMTVRTIWVGGQDFTVTGEGYSFSGQILRPGGEPIDRVQLAPALCLPNDATVSADGQVIGDPTEAAIIVLAAKLGIDADATRAQYPRVAEVPFDSDYKFMATFHHLPVQGQERFVEVVKGAPDVVLARCTKMFVPGGEQTDVDLAAANAAMEEMSRKGLRTLALAVRGLGDTTEQAVQADPMSFVDDLVLAGIVGIVDPPRAEAKGAIDLAHRAGIEVRMITGDHAVTAGAIGAELGLAGGAIGGDELRSISDEELERRLPDLHVFGRVTPQDKLRLVKMLQGEGKVVAMTGDAVNDAAAIKQANVGVAMGSGSEVTKQAAKLVLTDDNFATLVHAVELGRMVYEKIVSYLRFQMSQLFSLILLFVAATAFNINGGVALFPGQVLFLAFVVTLFAVLAIMNDPAPPGLMDRKPRDPKRGITSAGVVGEWLLYGISIFIISFIPLVWGPDEPSKTEASASITMVYVIVGLGTVLSALLMRRSPESGLLPPIATALKWLVWPVVILVASTEIGFLQSWLQTESLSGAQWLEILALLLFPLVVVEGNKWLLRRRARRAA